MERRKPHKSLHCKFCKPPGVVVGVDKPTPAQLETKTKLHLSHEVADLQIFDVYDEDGVADVESEACICKVEGQKTCPKCAPDKKALKKKVCDCPQGSKPHPNMANFGTSKKKKKNKADDDEFWWEKYDREHDAIAKETWAAYMAQRKQEKRFAKAQEKELVDEITFMKPQWYQKLSCRQVIYLEYLSTAIRLDLDENITDRTFFILEGLGLYPRPKKKVLQKCLRYCHYNAIRFLNQLWLLLQEDDPFFERIQKSTGEKSPDLYAWNDRIIMASICQLELPKMLREIMDRLPPLPQDKLLPPIPKPKYPRRPNRKYESPYDEPLWRERMNWIEKEKLERINRARAHMNTKRVKIPPLALQRRPSLIDARPPFLSQIEASQSFYRGRKHSKKKLRFFRRKKKAIFDSKVDITAIAGIEASEVSTTFKADSEEICVFMREQKEKTEEKVEEEKDRSEEMEEKKVEPVEQTPEVAPAISKVQESIPSRIGQQFSVDDESLSGEDDMPFVTPPKTQSGATIEEPCPAPKSSRGPPAFHYDEGRRELGLINQELCQFDPNKVRSNDDEENAEETVELNMNVEEQLKQVAQKLKELYQDNEDKTDKKPPKNKEKKRKNRKKLKAKEVPVEKPKKKKAIKKNKTQKLKVDDTLERDKVDDMLEEYGEMEGEVVEERDDICVCPEENVKKQKKIKKKRKKRGCFKKKLKAPQIKKAQKEKHLEEKTQCLESKADETVSCEPSTPEEEKIFHGDVNPLLKIILKDLSDEGFISAGYREIEQHPDIKQLIKYLKGEIVTAKMKTFLDSKSKAYWKILDKMGKTMATCPDLNISAHKYNTATWNDKNWIIRLAKKEKEAYYFKIGKNRANQAKDLYLTLFPQYFGTDRFLDMYYAYMIACKNDCIFRGLS